MSDIYIQVGNALRTLRMAYGGTGISQAELGKAVRVPKNTISRWETGFYHPSLHQLEALAKFFGVPISRLLPDGSVSSKQKALLAASAGLNDNEINEVIRYVLFRRAIATSHEHSGSE